MAGQGCMAAVKLILLSVAPAMPTALAASQRDSGLCAGSQAGPGPLLESCHLDLGTVLAWCSPFPYACDLREDALSSRP